MVVSTDWLLLRHFLSHYSRIGVNLAENARIVVHKKNDESYAQTKAVLEAFGIQDVVTSPSYRSDQKMEYVNDWLNMLKDGAWVIYADTDEFFEYPCDTYDQVMAGVTDFWGRMSDSFGPNFTTPDLQHGTEIKEQYPVSCPNLRKTFGGWDWKHMLFSGHKKGIRRHMKSSHTIYFDKADLAAYHKRFSAGGAQLVRQKRFFGDGAQLVRHIIGEGPPTGGVNLGYFPHYFNTGTSFFEKLKYKMMRYDASTTGSHNTRRRDVYDNYYELFDWSDAKAPKLTSEGLATLRNMCTETKYKRRK